MTTSTTATATMTPQEPETNSASSPKEAAAASNGTGANKRKRDTYTPTACNECKRRKIKCNGRTPCERCSRQLLDCRYRSTTNSDESTNVDQLLQKINALQSQVSLLSDHVATQHKSSPPPAAPPVFSIHEETAPVALSEDGLNIHSNPSPSFEGPTTSAFKIKIARDSLEKESLVDDSDDGEITRPASPSPLHHRRAFESVIDPMWTITHQEATRLHNVYEEEMGMMYPIVPHEQVTTHIILLYSRPGDLFGSKLESTNHRDHDSRLDLEDVIILKLIFACALAAEENGHSTLGMKLFHSTRDVINDCVWGAPNIKRIFSLTLASILFFQIDEERKAWRTIGIAIRMCLEMGLHQREILEQKALADVQKEQLVRLFWSLYVLDNRWSIGTGLPSHLDSDDIDPTLPHPEGFPYLTLMIEYSHLSAKVWKHISNPCCSASNNKKNEVEYIHWQILQWAESIPEYLKLPEKQLSVSWSPASPPNRAVQRLQCLLYLRTNLMRMLVYQPALLSTSAISQNTAEADMMVEIAKETIRFIFHLNETSNIYQLQQVTFNYFLVSALAVLLLAIAHAPLRYSAQCKEEFYLALELVKKFSAKSYVSKRLWKSIKGLQRYAPKPVGHRTQHESAHDGRNVPVHGQVGTPETLQAPASSLDMLPDNLESATQIDPSGSQMTQDFMSLFEMPETPSYGIVGSDLLGNEEWRSYPSEQSGYEALLSSTLNSCFGPSISLV